MDQTLYDETISSQVDVNPCIEKEVLYVQDQNGGSYNGQIQIDTSVLSNSGKWLAYSEAYLEIPLVLTFSFAGADAADTPLIAQAMNAYMVGLKAGHHHLIDSIQVDYNNTNVVQLQPFTNFYVSYKLMTTQSKDDLKKWGSITGFIPDTAGSFRFNAAANVNGDGYSNNIISPVTQTVYGSAVAAAPVPPLIDLYNSGYYERLKNTSYPVGPRIAPSPGGVTTVNTVNLCNQIGKSYTTDNNVDETKDPDAAGRIIQWNILATIRLKDLSDFFDKMPLLKGGFMRLILNYNSATTTFATTAAATSLQVLSANGVTMNSGRTVPFMVSSGAISNNNTEAFNPMAAPLVASDAGAANFTVRSGVVRTTNSFASSILNACRLYVPSYSLNPVYESQLLSLVPKKEIIYTDIYNYTFGNVASGGTINQILTNGIVNPKYVVVIPYANTAAGVFANVTVPTYQSPYDSSPATTTPRAALTNFNVQIGGKNIFQQNFQYDFESFMNEVSSANSINGGSTVGLANGLLGKYEWDNGYRYYVADISRRIPAEDSVPKSVVVTGTNASGIALDFVCFIVFERKIAIEMETGRLLPSM